MRLMPETKRSARTTHCSTAVASRMSGAEGCGSSGGEIHEVVSSMKTIGDGVPVGLRDPARVRVADGGGGLRQNPRLERPSGIG